MASDRVEAILKFLEEVNKFKEVERLIYVDDKGRRENDAEHTWHMCMYGILLADEIDFEFDLLKALKIIIVHDLVEIYAGDTFAYDTEGREDKQEREEESAQKLFGLLPEDRKKEMYDLWIEYEEQETNEAKYAKAIDKLQGLSQNLFSKGQVWKENDITKEMCLKREGPSMAIDPKLREFFEFQLKRADEYFP